ncbi:hypothetical protein ABW20_dc0108503 [Dactylellina cionopaga]|nr:hypothetical protein ABW20_dc0108503 [Dactylellina cionopaga]
MLNLTASYRIKKRLPGASAQRKNPLNQLRTKRPSSASSSSNSPRRPSQSLSSDHGSSNSFSLYSPGWPTEVHSPSPLPTTVPDAITYVLAHQFTPLPETLTGLGLSRDTIAEILNFRRSLPRVVPTSHLHSLLPSPTETERAITALVADGTLRRVHIRTAGNTTHLEGVITTDDFLKSIAQSALLGSDDKDVFLSLLDTNPGLTTITSDINASNSLPRDTIMSLLSAGFLIINSSSSTSSPSSASISSSSVAAANGVDITTLTRTTAMKSITPLPEKDHTHISTLASLSSISTPSSSRKPTNLATSPPISTFSKGANVEYTITPPHLGLLTHLLSSSKSHTLDILRRCPHRETTIAFLREKWDGGVSKNKNKTRKRGEEVKFEGRARKWKEFKGLTVGWVIGGLMGMGVVEGFDAVVGRGIKLVKGN